MSTPKSITGIRCNKCGDEMVSRYRHDFRRCGCGAVFIDGGRSYTRIGGNPEDYTMVTIKEADEE